MTSGRTEQPRRCLWRRGLCKGRHALTHLEALGSCDPRLLMGGQIACLPDPWAGGFSSGFTWVQEILPNAALPGSFPNLPAQTPELLEAASPGFKELTQMSLVKGGGRQLWEALALQKPTSGPSQQESSLLPMWACGRFLSRGRGRTGRGQSACAMPTRTLWSEATDTLPSKLTCFVFSQRNT